MLYLLKESLLSIRHLREIAGPYEIWKFNYVYTVSVLHHEHLVVQSSPTRCCTLIKYKRKIVCQKKTINERSCCALCCALLWMCWPFKSILIRYHMSFLMLRLIGGL